MAPRGSSPSHCQLPWEPCGQGITAISVTTSAEALPGPIPSLMGGPGLVDGAELRLLLGTCCARPLCCSCPGLQVFATSGSCTGQPHHRRVPRGVQAMATQEVEQPSHPGTGLTASLAHFLHPGAAECQSSSAPTATGLRLCWGTTGEHQVGAQGCARACPGSPGCSPGEARSREVCSHQYHIQTTLLTAPSHIFTPCSSTGPTQR